MAQVRVLVVCEGNLCRSPFAERMLALRLPASRFVVSSAGTRAAVGAPVDPRAAAALRARGASPEGFAARRLTAAIADGADLVLAATRALRAQVLEESPAALGRAFTILELAILLPQAPRDPQGTVGNRVSWCAAHRSLVPPDVELDVPDPVRASPEMFEQVVVTLDRACEVIAQALTRREVGS